MKKLIIPAILIALSLISLLTLKNINDYFFNHQLVFFIIGLSLFLLASKISSFFYFKHSLAIYVVANLLLLVTLFLGGGRGTHRWINLGLVNLQTSQLTIPLIGLFLAQLASLEKIKQFKFLSLVVFLILLPASLIFLQPDLGTSLWFLLPAGLTLFVSQAKLKHLLIFGLSGLIILTFAWQFLLKPYQKERLVGFVGSTATQEASPSVYNRSQALIAIGSGGFWGKGFGAGTQSQLKFLPEKQTDFIFATLTEEGGLFLAFILLGLFGLLGGYLFYQASNKKQKLAGFERLFLFYLASLISWQVFVNLGGNLGILPITGLPLPFVSYGGSAVVSWALALGIAQSITCNSHVQN